MASGKYVGSWKEWRYKESYNKTWVNLEIFFAQEYHPNREQTNITSIV